MRSGTSRLLAEGQLRPDLELKLNSLRLDPSWLGLEGQPLMVRGQGRDGLWRLRFEAPELTSAIGSFGFSGTNAHVIVEEAPRPIQAPVAEVTGIDLGLYPVVVSGRTEDALRGQIEKLRDLMVADDAPNLRDLSYSLATQRAHFQHRAVIPSTSLDGLSKALSDYLADGQFPPAATSGP